MPELNTRFGYPVLLMLLAGVAGGMVVFFKRKGWF
jgi:magnesium transporter